MPISRRQFCSLAGAAGLAAFGAKAFAAERPRRLRVIAYNVYACAGWPKDRPRAKKAVAQGQMAKRLAMELALYDPDIINFSESPSEAVVQEVAELLGMKYARFPSGGNWPGTLLSRFEILASQNVPLTDGERPKDLFTRHWGRGTIKLPKGETLIVHSAHLHPSKADIRLREIAAMAKAMRGDLGAGRSLLLMGDLNHTPDTKEYRRWMDVGWVDTFAKAGEGEGFTIKADMPKRRIDYVMAAGPIAHRIVESRPLFEGAFRLNVADPRAFALSDHLPQLATFDSGR
jgi:endonuclease/exonuclease/phosphatase family metal-dependent hydrolase